MGNFGNELATILSKILKYKFINLRVKILKKTRKYQLEPRVSNIINNQVDTFRSFFVIFYLDSHFLLIRCNKKKTLFTLK